MVAHQVLNRLAQTTFDDVHWGLLIRNHLRVLRTSALLNPGPDASLLDGSQLFDLGDVGYGAGDPADLAFDARGNLLVALAGVDEVAITREPRSRSAADRRGAPAQRPCYRALMGYGPMSPTAWTTRFPSSRSRQVSARRRSRSARDRNRPPPNVASGCFRVRGYHTIAG